MIRVHRGEAPSELTANASSWTDRWKKVCTERGDWATVFARTCLRAALRLMTHGKCVYCESKLEVDASLEIEHYVAKTIDHDLAFEWTNLFPACSICNRNKRDQDHKGTLLKADIEDPEPFFWIGPEGQIEPHPDLDEKPDLLTRAKATISICKLDRGGLDSSRYDMICHTKHYLLDDPEWLLAPERPYKLVIRHTLTRVGRADLAAEDRRRFKS